MTLLHICRPIEDAREVRWLDCPTCRSSVPMLCLRYEWYGWHLTCLGCGESWSGGEMCPRPFAPRWRQRSIADALRGLRTAKVVRP